VVRLLLEQALHGPIEADEGAGRRYCLTHERKFAWAKGTSRMADVYLRKITEKNGES
jgi:hypothetical protein